MKNLVLSRLIAAVLLPAFLIVAPGVAGAGEVQGKATVALVLNEVNLVGDVDAFIGQHGRTMVPIRLVGEALGSKVKYHQDDRRVHIRGEGQEISLWVESSTAEVNGRKVKLDAPPEIRDGRAMVPLRFVGENMGAKVVWREAERAVYIEALWIPTKFNFAEPLAGKVIVLDPGHGNIIQPGNWSNPGAVGNQGTVERDVVMDIALRARDMLKDLGARVVLTREGDTTISLAERAQLAEQEGADALVSIHVNSSTDPSLAGTATYYYPGSPPRREWERLARSIQEEVVKYLNRRDIGLVEADFTVIRKPNIPTVLLETAFISNPEEERLLADPGFRERAAKGIVEGITRYLEAPESQVAVR